MIPAISGFAGLIVKIIFNIILIQIPSIGVNGAAIASNLNNIVVFLISFVVLKNTIRLDLNSKKFIFKPLIATAIMCVCSYSLYIFLINGIFAEKMATIISLLFAVILYFISVIALKIFTKEELTMIPFGTKLIKILERLGIYSKEA